MMNKDDEKMNVICMSLYVYIYLDLCMIFIFFQGKHQ